MLARSFTLQVAVVLTGAGSLTGATTCRAEDRPASAEAPAKPVHHVAASAPAVKVGAKGEATIKFTPAAGFKWNKEYPAKVKLLSEPTKVGLAKLEFQQMKGDFKLGDKDATLAIAVTGKAAGRETVQAEASYSMCDDRTCLLEKTTVTLAFEVN